MVTVQRPDDMSPDGFLKISDNGNSFTLTTFTSEDAMSEFIEFCTSLGGGRSLNTLSVIREFIKENPEKLFAPNFATLNIDEQNSIIVAIDSDLDAIISLRKLDDKLNIIESETTTVTVCSTSPYYTFVKMLFEAMKKDS